MTKNNEININEEKNNIQLTGKVSATMKAFIENMPEGTFAEKIRSLIDSYSVTTQEKRKLKIERIQTLKQNLDVMEQTLKTIEQECNLYVNQVEETTKEEIEKLVKMAMEQDAVKVELEEKNKEYDKLLSNKEDLEKELDKSKINIEKLNEEVKLLQDTKLDLTNMNTQLNTQNVDLVSRENAALKEIESLKEVHSIEIAKLKEELLNTKDELKSTRADAKAKKELLEAKLENAVKGNEDLKVQIDEIKQEKKDIQEVNKSLEIEIKDLNTKLQDIEKVNVKLDAQNEEKANEISVLKDTLNIKEKEINKSSETIINLEKDNSKLNTIIENVNKDIEKLNKENDSLKENINNKELEFNELKVNLTSLEKDLEVAKNSNKKKDIEIKDLNTRYEEQINTLRAKIIELEKADKK